MGNQDTSQYSMLWKLAENWTLGSGYQNVADQEPIHIDKICG